MSMDDFAWLQHWYYARCDGDWEHDKRIHIGTLDNPGWSISVNIEDTQLQGRKFDKIEVDRSNDDWCVCFVENERFEGRGGPLNLQEILHIFRKWAES